LIVGAAAVALLLAACGDDDDDAGGATTTAASGGATTTAASGGATTTGGGGAATTTGEAPDLSGKTVRISGSETGVEADGFVAGMKPFEDATGAKVEFTGTRDFETQIRVAAEGGSLPDIALFPQPGLAQQLADNAVALTADTAAVVEENFDQYWTELLTVEGKGPIGIPIKADLKSLVWYSPKVFAEKGYTVPTTWDELIALQDKAKADGIAPWCIGIESGDATGWPFTDWMEDLMLRVHGPEVYDQWVSNELKFDDPKVKEVAEMVGQIWFPDGNVLNGRQSIASTGFATAGLPVADGDCLMHRQGNFFGVNYADAKPGTVFGEDGDINVFYLPTINDDFGKVTLTAGLYAVAMNDKPETAAAMAHLATPAYADARITAQKSGFLSANKKTDVSLFPNELDRTLNTILIEADPVRFDASDLMPGEVGSGAFWKDGTNYVNGTEDVDEFLANVQAAWPTS
jgi:alpha-glucoside transport system substrate-binding protein